MLRTVRGLVLGALVGMLAVSLPAGRAHAYDVRGVAVGADAALGGPSGLALSIGLGRLELDMIAGLTMRLPDGGVLEPGFSAAAGFFATLTDAEQTNFQLGGRLGVLVDGNSAGGFGGSELTTFAGFSIEVDARLEHRFDDHCAINFQVGAAATVFPDSNDPRPDVSFGLGGTGFVGGAGFRYWFDGLGGGAPSAPVAAPAEPVAAPASEAAPTSPYYR